MFLHSRIAHFLFTIFNVICRGKLGFVFYMTIPERKNLWKESGTAGYEYPLFNF